MPRYDAADLAIRLGRKAEAVCRHYLPAGRRFGHYWFVGDVRNTPGRSMFVRLAGPDTGKGAAGKWTDAATGEHGDLLDVIRESLGLAAFRDVAEEARAFLALPHPDPLPGSPPRSGSTNSRRSAKRLLAISQPFRGTLAETYLRGRGITAFADTDALRFHPRCYYRPADDGPTLTMPAMVAAVTDLTGRTTGAHRTWLNPDGSDKADVDYPRRAMGDLLGNGVRFGAAAEVMAAGEGIETVLSARSGLPFMPMVAALSAAHLAAILFPPALRRLYILSDRDSAGSRAREALLSRAASVGIEAVGLSPLGGDFNDDLRGHGLDMLCTVLRSGLRPEDANRFLIGRP
ncbi:DUF7146 domain-containing protein [Pelagibacterium halotolerans]|uniref:Uncharacterized protein n=1 Tax=Pelagibacterium halotolerans (strain DSM 22347 / JCM 15775 / CGMCC 1.7692 / B2) TaxID=1082931 RepID=G4RDR2_PELHB|nr:toprim domain-containing protein [Pelagibacterium halotolerans]AEQ52848.1 conserved hypothetical protein [Pelagibacterium halotolerans B2]QJR17472.1 DNA primase [Pelagibacterium halotolerans]SEA74839.1 Toprim domain-containing protein [Pelagibacterium halotolerans]